MEPSERAAALWGSAQNGAYTDKQRLGMALQALDYYGAELERTRDELLGLKARVYVALGIQGDELAQVIRRLADE